MITPLIAREVRQVGRHFALAASRVRASFLANDQ